MSIQSTQVISRKEALLRLTLIRDFARENYQVIEDTEQ